MRGRAHVEAEERVPVARPAPAPAGPAVATEPGLAGGLLGLQATAGNAAVGSLVERRGSGPCPCGGSGGDCACEAGRGDEQGEDRAGEALDPGARAFLEARFGRDLGDVRVHTGAGAAASAESAGAEAYTTGKDIVFAPGAYRPDSPEGRHLLAHEVAHTLQPERGPAPSGPVSRPGDPAEVAAARAADAVAAGAAPARLGSRPAGVVHRQAEDEEAAPQPVPDMSGTGEVTEVQAMANISLPGRTDASFSSSFTTQGATRRRGEGGCDTVAGNMVNTFTVSTTVTLPPVPDGLTECQAANAQRFIDTILAPHEQEHVAHFNTYNGTSTVPFSLTVCAGDDLQAMIQAEHDTAQSTRQAAAQALSDSIDPFNVDVDIDAGCEAPAE
ncbi:MAG: eCIS core domain-containing protein [Actinomycetota bacterium]